jgi:hypothetical protein
MTESLADDEAAYAYVRMKVGNDEYSERVKFAFVVWAGEFFEPSSSYICISPNRSSFGASKTHTLTRYTGPNTKVMRKAKMSFQSGQVKQVIRTYAVEVQTGDRKDLEVETVTLQLRKAMGANCECCEGMIVIVVADGVQMIGKGRATRYCILDANTVSIWTSCVQSTRPCGSSAGSPTTRFP